MATRSDTTADTSAETYTDSGSTVTRPLALARASALAVVLSMAGNALFLWVVLATDLVGPFLALSYPPVLFLSAVGTVGATVVYRESKASASGSSENLRFSG
jgi:hypothetical protein